MSFPYLNSTCLEAKLHTYCTLPFESHGKAPAEVGQGRRENLKCNRSTPVLFSLSLSLSLSLSCKTADCPTALQIIPAPFSTPPLFSYSTPLFCIWTGVIVGKEKTFSPSSPRILFCQIMGYHFSEHKGEAAPSRGSRKKKRLGECELLTSPIFKG